MCSIYHKELWPGRCCISYLENGDELKEIHKKSFPDMRYGQFMMNALGFINSTKKRDPFFPEEDEMLNLIKEYANTNSMWYQGWELLKK